MITDKFLKKTQRGSMQPVIFKTAFRRHRLVWTAVMIFAAALTGCGRKDMEFLTEEIMEEEENVSEASEKLSREEANEEEKPPSQPDTPQVIYVDVCGAVADPGVYQLPGGSRIFQAIDLAGGYLPEAASEYINRADFVSDGQQIYVPTEEEAEQKALPIPAMPGTGQENTPGSGMTGEAAKASGMEAAFTKVNLNTATEEELCSLSGIGTSKAHAIIVWRETNGPFRAIEDIMNVEGIKEGTFSKIKEEISVE